MEILGAGFCRTGTMSTRKALVDLGLTPCFHMESVVSNNLVSLFLQYFKGDKQPLVDYVKKEGYKGRDRFIPEQRILTMFFIQNSVQLNPINRE